MPTLKQLFGTPCELSELANYGVNSGLQDGSQKLRTCELGELGYDDTHPSSHGSQSSQMKETSYSPIKTGMFASSQSSQGSIDETDGYTYDPAEAARFWHRFTERIDECDRLIRRLCDLRHDSDEHRADLLAVRKRMAPVHLDVDIRYLLEEIERSTPTSSPELKRDCRDCEHHRGRAHLRYCLNPVGVVQRDDALASPIVDCAIASRCQAFKKHTL